MCTMLGVYHAWCTPTETSAACARLMPSESELERFSYLFVYGASPFCKAFSANLATIDF
jgi:hypothetical protein